MIRKPPNGTAMQNYKNINGLFEGGSERLTSLKERLRARSRVLQHVIEALPEDLSGAVSAAGVEQGQLTIGAINASWATRLRYHAQTLKQRVGSALGVEIARVRVRVQP